MEADCVEVDPRADTWEQNFILTESEPFIKGWSLQYKTRAKGKTKH